MQSKTIAVAAPRSAQADGLRVIAFFVVMIVLIVWSSTSVGLPSVVPNTTQSDPEVQASSIASDGPEGCAEDVESVTMTIPLEEGGVIDVDAPTMGVKIEKWSGNDVLVIVEKTKRPTLPNKSAPADPVSIKVTRDGKDVRIHATGAAEWRQSGMDVSFRIVLPDQYDGCTMTHDNSDATSRLATVLWHAFHREAIEWLVR